MGSSPTTLCPRCKETDQTHPHLFQCKLSQITLNVINELINRNCTFQFPFKICIRDILMGNSSHSHNGVKLEILPTLIEVFLRHLSFCRRKAFYDDGYNKIHELSNCKGNLISRFSVLREMSNVHSCSNHSNLEMEAEFLTKTLSYLNLNISRTKNGRNKL